MKYGKKLAALLLILALTLQLFACNTGGGDPAPSTEPPTESTTESTTEAPPSPGEIYEDAIAALEASDAGAYEFLITTTRHSGNATVKDEVSRILRYTGLGTDSYEAMLDCKTTFSDASLLVCREVYTGGKMYWFIPNELKEDGQEPTLFSARMGAEDYQARLLPLRLLDPALYESAVAEEEGRLVFTEPTEAESWLFPADYEYVSLTDAKGELILDSEGNFESLTYEVTYDQGFVEVEQSYTLRPAAGKAEPDTTLPERNVPVELENMDLPYLLAYSSKLAGTMADCSKESVLTELIVTEAAGAWQVCDNRLYAWGSGEDYTAKTSFSLSVTQGEESYDYSTEETLIDGVGRYTVDGELRQEVPNVNTETFRNYVDEEFSVYLPQIQHIDFAELSEVGGYWKIRFEGNDLYSSYLADLAQYAMFEDRNLLDDMADEYITGLLEGYFYIDRDTLLPVAISLKMESYHKIDGYPYGLRLNADQTYDFGNPQVYEEITGEMFPEEEPEEKATPVFYEVTSPEGQTMYLLGTIHIGDERTAYLPQEIYDAFDASDALAVEFDLLSFDKEVEEDEERQEEVASSYYYEDGSTANQHLPIDQYEQLLEMSRICGMTLMVDSMYPSITATQYTNRMFFGSNTLSSLQGVDRRFLTLAHERGMEVLEVESADFQMDMDSQYSDLLQKYLVLDAYETDRNSYVGHSVYLYELWCAGDEAALIEYLRDDEPSEDATEEEILADEEYDKYMLEDRDAGMLETAKEYLSSGKTVFFAVGLAHLLGETGLVEALREAGYTVTLVEYASPAE